jgi:hypothetical protein
MLQCIASVLNATRWTSQALDNLEARLACINGTPLIWEKSSNINQLNARLNQNRKFATSRV